MSRSAHQFRPSPECCEGRFLLSDASPIRAPSAGSLRAMMLDPNGTHPTRPNEHVVPFYASPDAATFIDPTARLIQPQHMLLGQQTYVAPFATLDATRGYIKVGSQSAVLDNATILANPARAGSPVGVFIGDKTLIDQGTTVRGPSAIGSYAPDAMPAEIGPNALIDAATIEAGAIVGALARVGPGVTVPSGLRVLPGRNVTTDAEASDPALGKVEKITPEEMADLVVRVAHNADLAKGYTTLFRASDLRQTDPVPPSLTEGTPRVPGFFDGNLRFVSGTSPEAGPPIVPFEPGRFAPKFPSAHRGPVEALLPQSRFPTRATGQVQFGMRPASIARSLGPRNSIRADDGQPITVGPSATTGVGVTVHAPGGGKVTIGQNVQIQDGAVILGGSSSPATLGDGVTVGTGAVIDQATIGKGSIIGARSYVQNSNLPAGTVLPPGTVWVDGKEQGTVEW
ncbi:MAG: carbonic anhydrase/acetyltransferase [Isosphaeraceae bacterium]|nr:carbonic anhydrase/acetyltransferase [Isosphaeraceae bacterium]